MRVARALPAKFDLREYVCPTCEGAGEVFERHPMWGSSNCPYDGDDVPCPNPDCVDGTIVRSRHTAYDDALVRADQPNPDPLVGLQLIRAYALPRWSYLRGMRNQYMCRRAMLKSSPGWRRYVLVEIDVEVEASIPTISRETADYMNALARRGGRSNAAREIAASLFGRAA